MRWDEVLEHLCATYQIAHASDRRVELWWRYPDDKIPIWQQQAIWHTEVNGEPYLTISAEVSQPPRVRAWVDLQRARIGQLVEDGDRLQLRLTLPAGGLAPPALDHLLQAVAHEAAQLSAQPRRWPSGTRAGARA